MSYMCKNTCAIYNATQHKIHTPVNNNIAQYYSRSFGSVVLFGNMVSRRVFEPSMEEVGSAVAQWLRHCATNRRVVGSIPDGVIRIFH